MTRLVGCPPERALGQSLTVAVPALGRTHLPRIVDEVLTHRHPRTVARVVLPFAASPRILEVRVMPVDGGATLIWHDLTERLREDGALRRSEARLALAAEAANDGLWEWDLRQQECFFSGRWREMVGLPAQSGPGRPEEWLSRVHPDDAALAERCARRASQRSHRSPAPRAPAPARGRRLSRLRVPRGRRARLDPAHAVASPDRSPSATSAQERMRSAGFLDPLTGLANRTVFAEQLGRRLVEFEVAAWRRPVRGAVPGPRSLQGGQRQPRASRRRPAARAPPRAGSRPACARPISSPGWAATSSRFSSTASTDEQQANAVAFRIQESLSAPFRIGAREVYTTASIGIAIGLPQYASPDEIMRDADTAMYHAKTARQGPSRAVRRRHARRACAIAWASRTTSATPSLNNDFEVHYQPIVLLASGMCVGFESLIRWKRNGVPVPPDQFIPLAEEVGLIEPIGTWVLRQACRTFADWQRRFPRGPGLHHRQRVEPAARCSTTSSPSSSRPCTTPG